ncbi:Oidioi.mRNA.OKI2018_I69.chr2.g6996.t1.cds [Oikopleura dioica]|uniref:Oidioi.mRNA.OKI2018_I69.chr2.g6996.t1.cds n=1 Tax=Oikopleura dioica TaxID=34765 RepID=A0ABN7T4R4_OIKDI|nr:Oidioi.mRNA.OKI2018_I69.chr2.g6996.t1.cds [Oikopleura dioica]
MLPQVSAVCEVCAGCLCDKLSINALSCSNSSKVEYHQLRVHFFPRARRESIRSQIQTYEGITASSTIPVALILEK